jgi:hypothetical protein
MFFFSTVLKFDNKKKIRDFQLSNTVLCPYRRSLFFCLCVCVRELYGREEKTTKEKKRMRKTTTTTEAQISSVGYGNERIERERYMTCMTRLVLVPNERRVFFFTVLSSAHDVGGGWGGLAPPTFWMCLRKFFRYVSGKFFPVVRRLSNLTDTVEYSFVLKIIFGIWQTVQNIHSF